MDKRILVLVLLVMGGLAWFLLQPGEPETAAGPRVGPKAPVAEMTPPARTSPQKRSRQTTPKSPASPTSESAPEVTPEAPAPEPVPTIAEARAAASSGDTAGAKSIFEEIASRGSRSAKKDAALALADLAEQSGNLSKTLEWRETAADNGDADSMVLVAEAYRDGIGVAPNADKSVKYFMMAEKAGRTEGAKTVENFRGEGNSDYIDGKYEAALKRFVPLAEGGDTSVMYTLATMYEQGQGTARSPRQALRWFRAAADAGDSRAMNQLASRYATGTGVARDDAQAVQLWRKAADAGEVSAMINLAQMYELGLGVPKSRRQAIAWNQKAAATGNRTAEANLKRLGN